jgi:hypothetical protein
VENFVFLVLVTYGQFHLSSDDLYLTSSPVRSLIHVKFLISQCSVLALADGLCYAWLVYPILHWCRCLEIGTRSTDWVQLSKF